MDGPDTDLLGIVPAELLAQCPDHFGAHFCSALGRYLVFVQDHPPVSQAGMVDPRGNLLRAAAAGDPGTSVLADLVVGKAHLAWRLSDAWGWLTPALEAAGRGVGPISYLSLQRELTLLRWLPLYDRPRLRPATWRQLQHEARLIGYLRAGQV